MKVLLVAVGVVLMVLAGAFGAYAFMGSACGMGSKAEAAEVKATCPVTGEIFKVSKMTPTYTHDDTAYQFCCADCIDEFKKNPGKYIKASGAEHKHGHD